MLLTFCSCGSQLGHLDAATASVRLFKWQVACQTTAKTNPPNSSDCLVAMLLTTLSRYGSSRSVITPTYPWEESQGHRYRHRLVEGMLLHVWILNSNIKYSSTEAGSQTGKPAIKLLYQPISGVDADKMLESVTADVHEVSLAGEALSDVWKQLQT